MTIANELRAEVATALLVNTKGDRKELLSILKTCNVEFTRLSACDHSSLFELPKDLISPASSQCREVSKGNC